MVIESSRRFVYQQHTALLASFEQPHTVIFFCRLLEETLKAMLTSLPLVSDLHHPAMRERHWQQLMKVGPWLTNELSWLLKHSSYTCLRGSVCCFKLLQ